MSKNLEPIAVFTGDLVGSTALTKAQIDSAFEALANCANAAAVWHGKPLNFTRHRGDGWQVVLSQPRYALRTALLFRATIKALGAQYDTYIGISSGYAENTTETDLNNRNDDVFVNSGRALETLKAMTSFAPKIAKDIPGAESAAVALADYIANDWTPAQSEAMAQMLRPDRDLSYTDLAKILNKSRQTVTKTLNAAGFQSIYLALKLMENIND